MKASVLAATLTGFIALPATEVMSIDLTGTMAGLDAVLTCQDEQG